MLFIGEVLGSGFSRKERETIHEPGYIVVTNGYTEENIQRAFHILISGLAVDDLETDGLRGWVTGHFFPPLYDPRVVRMLVTALSKNFDCAPFVEYDFDNLTGNRRLRELGTSYLTSDGDAWIRWAVSASSNLVWNGSYFELPSKGVIAH